MALERMRRATIADENGDDVDEEIPQMPLDWIIDTSRPTYERLSFSDPASAIDYIRRRYRKDFWQDRDKRVYFWLEKDALAAAVRSETFPYDVPLFVARGCNSISFAYEVAERIKEHDCKTWIYYFRDLDPTGITAPAALKELLGELLPARLKPVIEERAITPEQVKQHSLEDAAEPTKWLDKSGRPNPHAELFRKRYGPNAPSYELDALPAPVLRRLVREAIQEHVSDEKHEEELAAQKADREELEEIVTRLREPDEDYAWSL